MWAFRRNEIGGCPPKRQLLPPLKTVMNAILPGANVQPKGSKEMTGLTSVTSAPCNDELMLSDEDDEELHESSGPFTYLGEGGGGDYDFSVAYGLRLHRWHFESTSTCQKAHLAEFGSARALARRFARLPVFGRPGPSCTLQENGVLSCHGEAVEDSDKLLSGRLSSLGAPPRADFDLRLVCAEVAAVSCSHPTGQALCIVAIVPAEVDAEGELPEGELGWDGYVFTCPRAGRAALLSALQRMGAVRDDLRCHWEASRAKILGAGSVGRVALMHSRPSEDGTKGVAALKLLNTATRNTRVYQEVSMLVAAQGHPSIIGFLGLFGDRATSAPVGGRRWGILLDLHAHGDLYEYVNRLGPLCEWRALHKLSHLMEALNHLQERSIVHADVKPENLLMATDGRLVLTDFGLAFKVTRPDTHRPRVGSLCYAPPESLQHGIHSFPGDIFGAGIVLFFMICLRTPFHGETNSVIILRTIQCVVQWVSPWFDNVSTECKALLRLMASKQPQDRPTALAILRSRIVTLACARAERGPPEPSSEPVSIRRSSRRHRAQVHLQLFQAG